MTNENIGRILDELRSMVIVRSTDIPNIDLYMDQLTTFMENKLQGYKRGDEDKIITKTMINNYTKSKVLPMPNKKKYSLNQIATLIMIYHMKQVLSLRDINILLQSIAPLSLPDFFDAFAQLQQNNQADIDTSIEGMAEKVREITAPEDEEKALLLLAVSLILEANRNKLIVEKMIDSIFAIKDDIPSRK